MAIVWEKTVGATRYEVRSAGNTRRLYTNGVFHSQYNPTQPVTGSIWDLLLLPAFFYAPGQIRRVLVLGVGGGAVIRQLQHFIAPGHIVGVELNPVHLEVADKYFGLGGDEVELHEADAVAWINDYHGAPFDMIIDDIFGEKNGEPFKAVRPDSQWFTALLRHLAADGVLVSNFVSTNELRRCGYFADSRVRRCFGSAFQLTMPLLENGVGAFLRRDADSAELRERLVAHPQLNPNRKSSRLRYNLRKI